MRDERDWAGPATLADNRKTLVTPAPVPEAPLIELQGLVDDDLLDVLLFNHAAPSIETVLLMQIIRELQHLRIGVTRKDIDEALE